MIRTLFLCGVLSVGSAWGQSTTGALSAPYDATRCQLEGGHWTVPSGPCAWLALPALGTPQSGKLQTYDVRAQLDRIEAMLRAICEHWFYASGKPDCPKDAP